MIYDKEIPGDSTRIMDHTDSESIRSFWRAKQMVAGAQYTMGYGGDRE